MRAQFKLLVAALAAASFMAAFVGTASANRLAASESHVNINFPELTFAGSEGGSAVICPVTIAGSFHSRTISKVANSLIGYINRATVAEASCRGGRARALTETLPWHVQYSSFSGTLPAITAVTLRLINASFQIEVFGVLCLYRTTATNPARGIANVTSGEVRTLRAEENAKIPKNSGSFLCPPEGVFKGTGNVSPVIRVSLVV